MYMDSHISLKIHLLIFSIEHTPSLPPKDTPKRRSPRFSEGPMARSPQDHSSHSQPQPHLSHKRLKSAQPSSSQPHQLQQSSKETQPRLSKFCI